MFIFDKMEKVDKRAEVMLRKMEFERDWRLTAAKNDETQANLIVRPENHIIKKILLDAAKKLRMEAMEINDSYCRLKEVIETIHKKK